MHKVIFYPLGNADTCLIELENGKIMLFDYAHVCDGEDEDDKRINLAEALSEYLEESDRDYLDVVAFTHLDADHICGAPDFFHFEHAKKYQGEGRIRIDTLYVPAGAIIEEGSESEARIIRAEARYRMREGEGIRVFSRPGQLEKWLEDQGLSLEDREELITDAGQIVPEFSLDTDGVEIFVHSPFARRSENDNTIDRNIDSLALHILFRIDDTETKLFLSSDLNYEALTNIVNITRNHNNEKRLEWDILKTPHHCSYLSLSSDKGKEQTEPVSEVKWLLEEQAMNRGQIISTSKPIPTTDSDDQPPHRQAANYYKEVVTSIDGEFLVTMENPNEEAPEAIVIEIDNLGATYKKTMTSAVEIITSRSAPRAG